MFKVKRYNSDLKLTWNSFIEASNFPNLLVKRDYMEYHKNRFDDYSLMVFKKDNLVAVIPGNKVNNNIYSHQGLTFGGLYCLRNTKSFDKINLLGAVLEFLNNEHLCNLYLHLPPNIYSHHNNDDLIYAMHRINVEPYRIDYTLTIDLTEDLNYQKRRLRSINKASKFNISVRESDILDEFWNKILTPNLNTKYGVNPVHSLSEISYLKKHNPDLITQFDCYIDNQIVAGTTIYESKMVAHAQYISSSDFGKSTGAIDYLFDVILKKYKNKKKYFNLGIAHEMQGSIVNKGLLDWKESFGALAYNNLFYKIPTSNYTELNKNFSQ